MKREIKKAWDLFDDIAQEYDYRVFNHNDCNLGKGSITYKEDKFVPIIKLAIWEYPEISMSIFVEDRNGNSTLEGPYCAVHNLNDCPDFTNRFEKMCKYVFEKYSKYSRENRLDYVFNEMSEERIKWHEVKEI